MHWQGGGWCPLLETLLGGSDGSSLFISWDLVYFFLGRGRGGIEGWVVFGGVCCFVVVFVWLGHGFRVGAGDVSFCVQLGTLVNRLPSFAAHLKPTINQFDP